MARGRMVNTTIATDRRLASLSLTAEYLYLKTIPHLDRDGLILGDASLLWAKVAPRRPELLPGTDDIIAEWLALDGLVIAYDTPDGRALFFPGFAKNQIGMRYDREPESTIGCPPGYVRTPAGLVLEASVQPSGNPPAVIRQTSGSHPAEVKGIEVKREEKIKEKEGNAEPLPPPPASESVTFAREQAARLSKLNSQVAPALRTPLANVVLDMTGKRALADAGGSESEKVLLAAHEAAVTLYQMGVKSESALLALEPAWRDDWRGCSGGTAKQLLEFVSEWQSGKQKPRGNGRYAEPESNQEKLARVYASMSAGTTEDIWQQS